MAVFIIAINLNIFKKIILKNKIQQKSPLCWANFCYFLTLLIDHLFLFYIERRNKPPGFPIKTMVLHKI